MDQNSNPYVLCVEVDRSDLGDTRNRPELSGSLAFADQAQAVKQLEAGAPFETVIIGERVEPDVLAEIMLAARALQPAPTLFVPADTSELREFLEICARRHAPCADPEANEPAPRIVLPIADDINLLVIEDDESFLPVLKRGLSEEGFNVRAAVDGPEGLEILRNDGAQIIICDLHMPGMSGIELCKAVRANEAYGFAYFIMITGDTDKKTLIDSFEAGVDDFLAKPFDYDELLLRVRAGLRIIQLEVGSARRNNQILKQHAELAALTAKLERLATTDELTGLLNRRQAVLKLEELWKLSARYDVPLSCIMLDIDHFKKFNDTYGHAVGDDVLRLVAETMTRTARSVDVVARFGGEEFLILCPNTKLDGALILADRMRANIESTIITHDGETLSVTASLGVAQHDAAVKAPDDLLKAADGALYEAKAAGRNRAVAAHLDAETVAT